MTATQPEPRRLSCRPGRQKVGQGVSRSKTTSRRNKVGAGISVEADRRGGPMTGVAGFYETDPETGDRYQARRMVDGAAVDVVDYDGDRRRRRRYGDGRHEVSETPAPGSCSTGARNSTGATGFQPKRHGTRAGGRSGARERPRASLWSLATSKIGRSSEGGVGWAGVVSEEEEPSQPGFSDATIDGEVAPGDLERPQRPPEGLECSVFRWG